MFEVRVATRADVPAVFEIRYAVRENRLSSTVIAHDDYFREIEVTGRGWVAVLDGTIRGFSVGRRTDSNIWALFVHPDSDRRGLGRALHDPMVAWLFAQGNLRLWLTTTPATRAEAFYRRAGWRDTGPARGGEIRMELTPGDWQR